MTLKIHYTIIHYIHNKGKKMVRYLKNKDLTQKLSFKAENKKELKDKLLSLLELSIKENAIIEVRLLDVFNIIFKDNEEATIELRSALRGKRKRALYRPRQLRQGKDKQYNDLEFRGLGIHLEIFNTVFLMQGFISITSNDIIKAIRRA